MLKLEKLSFFIGIFFLSLSGFAKDVSQEVSANIGRMTGLPIPRFVSLKGEITNLRQGPSKSHAIIWSYQKRGLPVEIVNEFDQWRKIRDMDGSEGWLQQMVISGRRSVVTLDGEHIVRSSPRYDSSIVVRVDGGVVATPTKCNKQWCLIEHDKFQGWLPKQVLYGIYEDETFH